MPSRILFVDDELNVLNGLARTLRHKRKIWEMHFAQGVEEALGFLQTIDLDVVVSDISMPGKDGFALLSIIRNREQTKNLPFLMLTGLNDSRLKRKALDLGATDLLNKPADPEDLLARINNMLRLKAYQDEIKTQNELLDKKVKERTADLEASRLDLIWRLGKAAEYRDTDTGSHVVRVGYYSKVLAETLGMDREFTEMIFLTSPLHDIGKIGIPDNILLKQGRLTPYEWKIMKKHCEIGSDILRQDNMKWASFGTSHDLFGQPASGKSDNPFLKMAEAIALSHHERWDGNGYPSGLSADDIPIESRIASISDVCDALFSKRPYKPGYSESEVIEIMRENNGTQFDPEIFACFERSLDLFGDIRAQFVDAENKLEDDTLMTVRLCQDKYGKPC